MKPLILSKMKFLGLLLFFCSIILLQFSGQANAINGTPTFSRDLIKGPGWKDGAPGANNGWDQPMYYSTIHFPDINGDGSADACARGSGYIQCFLSEKTSFSSSEIRGPQWGDGPIDWSLVQYYSTIQFPDINGDKNADICGRYKEGIECYISKGTEFSTTLITGPDWSDNKGWSKPQFYSTIQFPDINGDGNADICGRNKDNIVCYLSNGSGFDLDKAINGPSWSDSSNWNLIQYYSTIKFPDIDGDGSADICGRSKDGIQCYKSNENGFDLSQPITGPAWKDGSPGSTDGWDQPQYYSTIQYPDINGDGNADICGRSKDGIQCYKSNGNGFDLDNPITGPAWADSNGWDQPQYYSTIRFPDLNGDGFSDACARGYLHIECFVNGGSSFSNTQTKWPTWGESAGWGLPQYYSTIEYPDINGDKNADICGRHKNGIGCYLSVVPPN
jgi:hypothetical protein